MRIPLIPLLLLCVGLTASAQESSSTVPPPTPPVVQTPPPCVPDLKLVDRTRIILEDPGDLRERLDEIIAQFADSDYFVTGMSSTNAIPATPDEAAEALEHSISRLPGMEIAYAIEYRGYFILSYPKGYSSNYRKGRSPKSKNVAEQETEPKAFTDGWLVKKGEIKFRPFWPKIAKPIGS
jgi:hypothetical protein